MGKKDLSGIDLITENILPNLADKENEIEKEYETKTVTLKITPTELKNLKKNAGLVPISTYIKHVLRNETKVFSIL